MQAKTVRCAIYTRKSTEEGLEQEFNSLDAQREAGENYVRSQAGEGWTYLPDRYDDGGFRLYARMCVHSSFRTSSGVLHRSTSICSVCLSDRRSNSPCQRAR
jgi:superoxide dismutase